MLSGYLLDTHVVLTSVHQSVKLPSAIRAAIERGPNVISVISYWEVMIKSMKGKLDVGDPRIWWPETLLSLSATPLPILPSQVERLHNLPRIHADPFDRLLIAQAIAEKLTLLTWDSEILKYAPDRFSVVH
ncbi:MAG: type II toxin-antitoxin system VapC family toxin [Acidobacteriia bacterium]|nr:type II toxin-antitoxin system VapC family toxin [Terriglobia bacterium]